MGNGRELVQVVIPCFNGEKYLEETLVSIQNQTHKNFDCLMVDDGSSDDSLSIFLRFAQDDPRFRLLNHEENLGESYTVNRGWHHKKGKLISILSYDDPQPHDWLERMIKFRSENPGFIVYYPNRSVIDECSKPVRCELLFDWSKSLIWEDLLCIVSVGAIIDSEFLPSDFEPRIQEVVFPSDLIQYLKLSHFGDGIRHPNYYSIWREHGNGKSADDKKTLAKEFASAMNLFLKENEENYADIHKSVIFANVVRVLQGQFSFFKSFILGLKIYSGEFEFRSINIRDLFKVLIRFRQRQQDRKFVGF